MSSHPVAVQVQTQDESSRDGDFAERKQCPGCGSTAYREIFSAPYESPLVSRYMERHYEGLAELSRLRGTTFSVCRCDRCTLMFQPLAPAGRLIQDIYDRWIPPMTASQIYESADLQSCRYRVEQVDFLIQTTGLRPGAVRFLDFGSGWSEWLCVARGFGCDIAGAELSVARQDYAAGLGVPMLDWQEIGQRRFNVINLEQVLEHLVDPREVLSHLRNSLENNGVLRVSVPDCRRIAAQLAPLTPSSSVAPGYLMAVQPLEHLNCFTHASLTAIGRSVGLRLLRPSLRKLYDSVSGWCSVKGAGRNLVRPIYRHVFPKSTIVFFGRG